MTLLSITAPGVYDLNEAPYLGGASSGELDNRVLVVVSFWYNSDTITLMTHGGDDVVEALNIYPSADYYLGAGNDVLYASASYSSNPTLRYFDQAGNDSVTILTGSMTVYAGAGNDRFEALGEFVQTIDFSGLTDLDGGIVAVSKGIVFDLAKTGAQNLGVFGKDVVLGFDNVVGTAGHDRLSGTSANNTLVVGLGNDLLNGRAGSDRLVAGLGSDTLIGGAGVDRIELGGPDAVQDILRYQKVSDSTAYFNSFGTERIEGFAQGEDKIDLSAIDAMASKQGNQAFVFRATGDFRSKGGEIVLEVIGSDTLVLIDTDGDQAPEMTLWIAGVTNLSASDFIL